MAMTVMTYSLAQFVNDLRAVTGGTEGGREIVGRVRPLVQRLALGKNWLEPRHYICDTKQGFGAPLLHEQSDHSLAVLVGAWLPGRGAPTTQPRDVGRRCRGRGRREKHLLEATRRWLAARSRRNPRTGREGVRPGRRP